VLDRAWIEVAMGLSLGHAHAEPDGRTHASSVAARPWWALPRAGGVASRVMTTQTAQPPIRSASRMNRAEQLAYYSEQGYLVLPELLSATELAELRSALAEVLREADGLTETTD